MEQVKRVAFYGGSYQHKSAFPVCECKGVPKDELQRHLTRTVKNINDWGAELFQNPDWTVFNHEIPEDIDPTRDPALIAKDMKYEFSIEVESQVVDMVPSEIAPGMVWN